MVRQWLGASKRCAAAARWQHWLAPSILLFAASCLLPDYELDDADATGGSSAAAGTAGAAQTAGGSAGATAGTNTGTGGSGVGEAGAGALECATGQKSCGGTCVNVDDPLYGCGETSCNQTSCPASGTSFACEAGECVVAS